MRPHGGRRGTGCGTLGESQDHQKYSQRRDHKGSTPLGGPAILSSGFPGTPSCKPLSHLRQSPNTVTANVRHFPDTHTQVCVTCEVGPTGVLPQFITQHVLRSRVQATELP